MRELASLVTYSPKKRSRPGVDKNNVRVTSSSLQHTKLGLWAPGASAKCICRKTVACRLEGAEKSLVQTEMSLTESQRVTRKAGGDQDAHLAFPWVRSAKMVSFLTNIYLTAWITF